MPGFKTGELVDGKYEIQSVLGSGGMGTVYRATQLNLDRTVAIKVPSEKVLENEEFTERFLREAHMCAHVAHPHVVSIFDVHDDPQAPYIVMEYVDGRPLHEFLTEQSTSLFVSDLLDIVGQVCGGLDAAHNKGIIHRDIKPANIVITTLDRQVKLMDFGIARALDQTSITMAGAMMGTPYYMAPEQIQGGDLTGAADIYSMGCVVNKLLTGHNVFEGEVATLIYKHVSVEPDSLLKWNPELPEEIDRVVLRALSKKASERYSTCMEFHRELNKALRSIGHLPYTQIFPSTGDGPFVTGRTKRAELPSASSEPTPPTAIANSLEETDISHMATPAPEVQTMPSAAPPRPDESQTALSAHKKSKKGVWIAVATILVLAAFGGGVMMMKGKLFPQPDDKIPVAHNTPAPTPQATAQPDVNPNIPVPDTAEIIMLRQPDKGQLSAGDFLLVSWDSSPEPDARRPFAYTVQLTGPGGINENHTTQVGNFTHPLPRPGQYTLRIAGAAQKPEIQPVQLQIQVK